MKKLNFALSVMVALQLMTSCNSTKSIASIDRQQLFKDAAGNIEPTLFTSHTDATQRISIIMADKNGKFITFAENPPDAAIQSALGIFGKADVEGKTAGKVSAEAKLDFAKTIAELGKRSEAINFQRDGMFRLSELFNNGGLTQSQLLILIDSLQQRAVRIVALTASYDKENVKLEKLKELNKLFSKIDSTATKPTSADLIKLLNDL